MVEILVRLKRLFKHTRQRILSNEEFARSLGVRVGKSCRIYTRDFGSEPYLISLGDHVTLAQGVAFSTHDGGVSLFRDEFPNIDYIRPIIIYDNCFIGMNAIILPGILIGPNSIIGAGSVVTRSIPPNCVAAGVPARIISTLDVYRRHIKFTLPTYNLTFEEKKKYYLEYFGSSEQEWINKMNETEMD